MMPFILLAAAASADLDALDQAVVRCDRNVANPVFAGETARHSQFLLDAFREEESIVAARAALTDRRRLWRESEKPSVADDKVLKLEEASVDDRQRALNDKRMLEGIRVDAMDSMRHFFLTNCAVGKDISK